MGNKVKLSINKELFLDDLFNNSYVAILVVNCNREIVLVNKRFCEMFGYKEEEILEKNVSFFHIDEQHYKNFGEMVFKHVLSKEPMSLDFEFRKKDNTHFWARISGDPLKHEDYVLWTLVDITEIYKIQNALKEQSNLLKMLIDEIPYPVVMKNYDGKFVLVNKFTAKLYGSTSDEMIGKDDGDYIPDKEMAEFFRKNVREIMDKGETQVVYEDSIDVETNETRNYMSIKKPFKNEQGEKFILVLANDITELKKKNEELSQKERLLFQQSKLASMGEMLANIAHQWRQPLSAISTQATGLQLEKEMGTLSDERLEKVLNNINNTTQFLSQTIEDFRKFYDPKNTEKKTISIAKTVEKTLKILKGQFKSENIKVIRKLVDYEVNTLENELIQVLINILNNAKDALLKVDKNRFILIKTYKKIDNLVLEINDSAKGIDEEILNKIFEPYFTTKHKSIGTGIGLYMSEEIIVKHLNGQINALNSSFTFDDKKYTGAKFIIKIPLN